MTIFVLVIMEKNLYIIINTKVMDPECGFWKCRGRVIIPSLSANVGWFFLILQYFQILKKKQEKKDCACSEFI